MVSASYIVRLDGLGAPTNALCGPVRIMMSFSYKIRNYAVDAAVMNMRF